MTTTDRSPSSGGVPPDPEGKAASLLSGQVEEKGGRPAGRPPKPSGWTPERRKLQRERFLESMRKGRERAKGTEELQSEEKAKKREELKQRLAAPIEEPEVQAVAFACGTLWSLVGPMARLRALQPEEERQLARSTIPVLRKYLPVLEDWTVEITFAITLVGLVRATHIPEEPHAVEGAPGGNGGADSAARPGPEGISST